MTGKMPLIQYENTVPAIFVRRINRFVAPNDDTQPEFGQALVRAAKAGVQVVYYCCHVEADSIRITGTVGDTGRYAGR